MADLHLFMFSAFPGCVCVYTSDMFLSMAEARLVSGKVRKVRSALAMNALASGESLQTPFQTEKKKMLVWYYDIIHY